MDEELKKSAKVLNGTSLLFIVYFLAGGELSPELSLFGSGIKFSRPLLLKTFAIGYLMLVFYRYLIIENNGFKFPSIKTYDAFEHKHTQDYLNLFIQKLFTEDVLKQRGLHSTFFEEVRFRIKWKIVEDKTYLDILYAGQNNKQLHENVEIFAEDIKRIKWKVTRVYLFSMHLSSHKFYPYLLFCLAISVMLTSSYLENFQLIHFYVWQIHPF